MNLIRRTGMPSLLSMENWFDDFLDTGLWGGSNGVMPAVDIRETESGYLMEVDLPGHTEKDVEVKLDNNLLTISSRKDEKHEEKKDGYLVKERRYASFSRSFVLPDEIDREKIDAQFKNGVLTLSFAKTPSAKPKLIEVKKS